MTAMVAVNPTDEARHQSEADPLWNESVYLDFFAPDGSLGGYIRMGLYPNLGVSWYWACLVGPDRQLVMVVENQAPLPSGPGLELRTDGLWQDIVVETPLDHVSVGLEAFGVGLDDPAEAYTVDPVGALWGDRTPIGFELDWDTAGQPYGYPVTSRYEIPCRVHGEILVGEEVIDFEGFGQRDHSWGVRDWWASEWMWLSGRFADGERMHALDYGLGQFGVGYRQIGEGCAEVTSVAARPALGAAQIPTGVGVSFDELELQLAPIAWAPVLLTSPDGRLSRFPRAMVAMTDQNGRTGHGWVEFNQPQ